MPVSRTAQTTATTRVVRIGTPRVDAASSPRFITSSRRERASATQTTAAISGKARREASMFSWASEPLPQAKSPVVFWLNRMSSMPVAASRAIAIADPARTRRVPVV